MAPSHRQREKAEQNSGPCTELLSPVVEWLIGLEEGVEPDLVPGASEAENLTIDKGL